MEDLQALVHGLQVSNDVLGRSLGDLRDLTVRSWTGAPKGETTTQKPLP